MKKPKQVFVTVLAAFFLVASGAYAEDNPASKLGRGVANIATSPLEYIYQIMELRDDHDEVTAFLGGLVNGTRFMAQRICVGAYEILTFPLPFPSKYGPVMNPDTPLAGFQDFHENLEEQRF